MTFRSCNHKMYNVSCNKISMHKLNESDKKLQDDDRITIYPHE